SLHEGIQVADVRAGDRDARLRAVSQRDVVPGARRCTQYPTCDQPHPELPSRYSHIYRTANAMMLEPAATATICLPSNEYVIGDAFQVWFVWKDHSTFPSAASAAIIAPSSAPKIN